METLTDQIWRLQLGSGPLIATAVHDGHEVRRDVLEYLALTDLERLREEDPFTGIWAGVSPTQVSGLRSRFEVDLNRPRDKAVYRLPEDAWGLNVWKNNPSEEMFQQSLAEYDDFYHAMSELFKEMTREHGHFLVFDLHTYNQYRDGRDGPPADPEGNPQVNIGTGTLDRQRWAPVIDAFVDSLRSFDFPGGNLDVRENVKFQGGHWPRWIHENFPESGIAIAIEFKKFFMNEWTGEPNQELVDAIHDALQSTVPATLAALERV